MVTHQLQIRYRPGKFVLMFLPRVKSHQNWQLLWCKCVHCLYSLCMSYLSCEKFAYFNELWRYQMETKLPWNTNKKSSVLLPIWRIKIYITDATLLNYILWSVGTPKDHRCKKKFRLKFKKRKNVKNVFYINAKDDRQDYCRPRRVYNILGSTVCGVSPRMQLPTKKKS